MFGFKGTARVTVAMVALVGLLFGSNLSAQTAANAVAKPMKVKWLIAHEPVDAFRRAAKIFSEQLAKESKGEMELVVLTPKDFGVPSGNMSSSRVLTLLGNNEIQLSQTLTTGLGEVDSRFYVLDLPFLFKSHEHARKILEGPIGTRLLASLEKSNIKGLAFTYSGGYRVVPSSSKAIKSIADFKGMKVGTTGSPVAQETLRLLGAVPVPISIEEQREGLDSRKVDAAETTYIRVAHVAGDKVQYINETEHSLFLTSILANQKFMESLSAKNRQVLEKAARSAARIERDDSIADGIKVRAEYEKKGVEIVKMSPENLKAFEKQVQPVYTQFDSMFGKGLVQSILAQK